MFDYKQYQRNYFMPPQECLDWAKKEYVDQAPVWCSVETDLEAMAKEMGLVPVRTAAVINRNRESGDYGLVVRVEMEVEPWPDKGENETDDGRDVVQAVNPVKPVEQVNVDIGKRQENGETEAGTNEDEEQEPLPREGTLEQLRRKVEGYYGLEAGKVEIEFQGR